MGRKDRAQLTEFEARVVHPPLEYLHRTGRTDSKSTKPSSTGTRNDAMISVAPKNSRSSVWMCGLVMAPSVGSVYAVGAPVKEDPDAPPRTRRTHVCSRRLRHHGWRPDPAGRTARTASTRCGSLRRRRWAGSAEPSVSANRASGAILGRLDADVLGAEIDLHINLSRLPDHNPGTQQPVTVTIKATDTRVAEPDAHRVEELRSLEDRYLRLVGERAACSGPV